MFDHEFFRDWCLDPLILAWWFMVLEILKFSRLSFEMSKFFVVNNV